MADINPNSDPRVGSSRDNSTTTTLAGVTTGSNSSSGIALGMTLLPVSIYALVCFTIFLILRRKYPRVYSPRTLLNILDPHERSSPLPLGWFNWIKPFANVPDAHVLNHSSLDGFLFLRYIKMLCVICLVGCCVTWPVLIPLHAHGGMGSEQLDAITFGNVSNHSWYYVHALQAWVFFGFIIYMVSRECVYYINLRQAYLLSPLHSNRLSSRTVLFSCVPQQILDEAKIRKVFGDSVKNVWISRDTDELDKLVKEREQTAFRLEKAEILLIKKANAARNLAIKNGHPDIEVKGHPDIEVKGHPDIEANDESVPSAPSRKTSNGPDSDVIISQPPTEALVDQDAKSYPYVPPPDINGSVASQWLPHNERPRHRPLANYGRRVDTIKWTRSRLKILTAKINKLRRQQRLGKGKPIPAVFIEFDSQVNAQSAYQALAHHRALHMSPKFIGVRPYEIVWSSLRMRWWERIVRRFSIQAFVTVMIIFWSIPCALVGIISNINFLTNKVPFLYWINDLPKPILGIITGLLPAVALSFLMAIVPAIMRKCARLAGVPSLSMIELFVQNAYFGFQVIQVFLITTLTSAASAAFTQILQDPLSVRTLLSANLPKASNFYVSYFILQGLASSATRMVHISALFRHQVLKNSSENPRFVVNKWHRLRRVHWGSFFPVYTNMAVIAISYSCIAPVILGFAGVGLFLVYLSFRYNLIYVYDSEIDTKGLLYPRAWKQTLTGVYLAEICLLGLFGIGNAFGPLLLMIILLVFTVLIHLSLNEALSPLLYNLPKTLCVEEMNGQPPADGIPLMNVNELGIVDVEKYGSEFEFDGPDFSEHGEQSSRTIEGAEGAASFMGKSLISFVVSKVKSRVDVDGYVEKFDFWTRWISPDPNIKPNFLVKWLHPEVYADYSILRQMLTVEVPQDIYSEEYSRNAYYSPSIVKPTPSLWIPRDPGGISQQEVAHTSKVNPITDEGAWLDEKNRVVIDLDTTSPIIIERFR